jgi:hypothetical protein
VRAEGEAGAHETVYSITLIVSRDTLFFLEEC